MYSHSVYIDLVYFYLYTKNLYFEVFNMDPQMVESFDTGTFFSALITSRFFNVVGLCAYFCSDIDSTDFNPAIPQCI
jgi:hypothetical protein